MGEKYCTLLPESPFSAPSNVRQEGSKPSKILTRHRVPSRAKFGWFFTHFAIHEYQLLRFDTCRMRPDLSDFAAKSPKRAKKTCKTTCFGPKNIGLFWHKHPYFPIKTSVLCGKEVRCFRFSGRKTRGNPFLPILQYFRPRQGLVASEALLSPLTMGVGGPEGHRKQPTENIAHSLSHPPESKLRKQGIPPKKTNKT